MRSLFRPEEPSLDGIPEPARANIAALLALVADHPQDLRARKNLGDAFKDAGRVDDAVRAYQAVVGAYAAQGLVFRAIAACKQILDLVPDHDETTRILAELYARRAAGKESAELSPSMSAALMSDEGEPVSIPDGHAVLLPPPLPDDDDDGDTVDVTALAGALTPLPEGAVRIERPPSVPLFSGLSPAMFQALVARLSAWEAEPGALIVGEGELSDGVFVIVRGRVRVERAGVLLAVLGADHFFGEMALLSKRPRAASVTAEVKTELLEIPQSVLAELMEKDPGVSAALDQFSRARLLENLARTSPLLKGLPGDVVKNALARFESRRSPAITTLVRQGAPAAGLFVVLHGRLAVAHADGTALAELGPGDVFGEMSLLSGAVAAATVTALEECSLLVLERGAFGELMRAHPLLEERLRALAASRHASIAEHLPDETSSAVLV